MVRVDTLLAPASYVAVSKLVKVEALVGSFSVRSKTVKGRCGKRPMCNSLGTRSVAALTELL